MKQTIKVCMSIAAALIVYIIGCALFKVSTPSVCLGLLMAIVLLTVDRLLKKIL